MSKCNNCGKKLGCGCQKRVAKNGVKCCAACVADVNKKFDASKSKNVQATKSGPGVVSAKIVKTMTPHLPSNYNIK